LGQGSIDTNYPKNQCHSDSREESVSGRFFIPVCRSKVGEKWDSSLCSE
jgi:hypothetical protein